MTITPHLFEAFLKCPTKCWLRQTGEPALGNDYAEWVRAQDEAARVDGIKRLIADAPDGSVALAPPTESLKTAIWRLATDVAVRHADTETRIPVVERVPPEGRGKAAQFLPVRFVWRNKLHRDDKLLLAFDALALSETFGRAVTTGKIIHGDDSAMLKVKLAPLIKETRRLIDKNIALISSPSPPDLVLNRHCAECEFQARCRKIAVEKDDLSLLGGMNAKERQKLRSKGIFTVTQLSYTFRPRHRPRRQRDKREMYHHALKALAIREKKIHIVGSPELKIEGTPVYLDVEGLPDRDFYYLIGLRIGNGGPAVQHSLWADTVADERRIWDKFLAILATVEKPVLIHYGSYETVFLRRMCDRYAPAIEESTATNLMKSAVNLLSFFFAQVYFSTFSNGLKEIAKSMGFRWPEETGSGLRAILWRHEWERSQEEGLREKLNAYNGDDCAALEFAMQTAMLICRGDSSSNSLKPLDVAFTDKFVSKDTLWPRFSSSVESFAAINKAAQWDYQRDRVRVRSDQAGNRAASMGGIRITKPPLLNKEVICAALDACPMCQAKPHRSIGSRVKILHDVRFGRFGIKRWVVKYRFGCHRCSCCRKCFGTPQEFWQQSKYGRNVVALIVFEAIERCIPQHTIKEGLNRLLGLGLSQCAVSHLKTSAAKHYDPARRNILAKMIEGNLVHADETRIVLKGKAAYVWVFATRREVVYFYAESRDGDFAKKLLAEFKGVLVSDFYAVYDSIECGQQKCLIHLMRDLNDALMDHPFDEDVKKIATAFAELLKSIVATIDRRGLKRRFLRKHRRDVARFYRRLSKDGYRSEVALKCKERFERNRGKLFVFLDHDGVSWNNNNAEHAIKAFARLRRGIEGLSTPKGIEEYLILLSVCQTCKYMGMDFLDFLRSGEKDVYAFAERRRRRTPARQNTPPAVSPAGPATQTIGAGGLAT